jgi:cysteine desulfurase/selenocysteine lyase
VLGTIAPLREIRRAARAVGAAVVVDGAQAAPHGLADVSECDFYAFSGHKVYGPSGTGVLYGRAEHLAEMDPWLLGGHIVEEVTETGATFRVAPARFEAGTPNIEGVIGLAAALRWLKKQRIDHRLLRRAVKGLRAMRGVRVLGSPQVGLVSFTVDGAHAHDVATWLDAHGIAVRAGGLCAQPLLRRLGVDAAVRCSFGVYNTEADVDALLEAVRGARGALAA